MISRKVPVSIVVGRILFVTGLSLALAIGFLFLLGGIWLWGVVALLCALPFLGLMFLVERAQPGDHAPPRA